jgi:hypothetical protein
LGLDVLQRLYKTYQLNTKSANMVISRCGEV